MACGGSTADRYTAALAARSWPDALSECHGIADEPDRSDCLVAILESNRRPLQDCDLVSSPLWREECQFMYAERVGSAGAFADAFATCDGLPNFAGECNHHILSQAIDRPTARPPREVGAAFARRTKSPDHEERFWGAYFSERFVSGLWIDATTCPTTACTQGARDAQERILARQADPALRFRAPPAPP